jgi:UDP-glucuronate 4-epimerase
LAPFIIYNIGASNPVKLIDFITTIESALGKETKKEMLPMQLGDVKSTYADISDTQIDLNYMPRVLLKDGIKQFVEWYLRYYQGSTHE